MKKLVPFARIVLALVLVVFGLNGFFQFIKPPTMSFKGDAFIRGLLDTGYMLPLWKGTEVMTGTFMLLNRYVALCVVLVAPIVVNILCFHLFLDPGNLPIGIFVSALTLIVGYSEREKYRPLFQIR
jgi:hypothetical protein